jgi:serine protease Do
VLALANASGEMSMSTPILSQLDSISTELGLLAERVRASVVQVHAGRRGIGSGIVWQVLPAADGAPEATIITNAHVVLAAGDAPLSVRSADGQRQIAALVATDRENDLAALRVPGSGLSPASIGDSTALRVGELVLAVGNPFGREGAATVGVVAARAPADPDLPLDPANPAGGDEPDSTADPSDGAHGPAPRARQRWAPGQREIIQADIRLYPGNSGGPLTDMRGRVVGVNAMVAGGLAFAIPSRSVRDFLEQLSETAPQRLGVEALTAPLPQSLRARWHLDQETAVLIAGIESGGTAESAGLLVGDVLVALDDIAVQSAEQLVRIIRRVSARWARSGGTLTVLRGGERVDLAVAPAVSTAA